MAGWHAIQSPAWTLVPRVIAVRGRVLLIMLLCSPALSGCGVLQTSGASWDGWLTRARRQWAQAARDIEADLDFHENEGLEGFDRRAVQQVSAMRSDMNGAAGVSR